MDLNQMVVTIGGGSGMPIVNRALVKAGFKDIKSIVTIFDSGGDTGRMRTDERGQILAFSDYWRSLISLWKDGKQKEIWEDMLKFRDGRSRNFGNMFFQFMSEKAGGLGNVDDLFSQLTGAEIVGEVIPVSNIPAEVCFKTKSGRVYSGEHRLDELRMSKDMVKEIWLEPSVEANGEALLALEKADIIIVCPGSMHGSVITNFLPNKFSEKYINSSAKKILMTNIMSMANENDGFTQKEYVDVFKKLLQTDKPFDLVIMADLGVFDKKLINKVLGNYEMEYSRPIISSKWNEVETWVCDIANIEEKNLRLRHGEDKMAKLFAKL